MALSDYLRPDYPRTIVGQGGIRKVYLYRGPTSTLEPLIPLRNSAFEGSEVASTSFEPVGTSAYSDLIVETFIGENGEDTLITGQITDNQYPFFEIEWVQVEKSLRQHPAFAAFDETDWNELDQWEKETDTAARSAFQYYNRDSAGEVTGSIQTLGSGTDSQQTYAGLRLKGVEAFLDFAPVARKTSRYRGSTMPTAGDAGQKIVGDPFTGVPAGYEWLKTADRISKQGVATVEWLRQEEWTGARTILLDKDEIF
jgi:hypothetical protein